MSIRISNSTHETVNSIELSVTSLKERRSRGFDPLSRKHFIKSSLVVCVLGPILEVGCKFGPSLAHGVHSMWPVWTHMGALQNVYKVWVVLYSSYVNILGVLFIQS